MQSEKHRSTPYPSSSSPRGRRPGRLGGRGQAVRAEGEAGPIGGPLSGFVMRHGVSCYFCASLGSSSPIFPSTLSWEATRGDPGLPPPQEGWSDLARASPACGSWALCDLAPPSWTDSDGLTRRSAYSRVGKGRSLLWAATRGHSVQQPCGVNKSIRTERLWGPALPQLSAPQGQRRATPAGREHQPPASCSPWLPCSP